MTLGELKRELAKYADDCKVYAYEGEDTGLVIKDHGGYVAFIACPESPRAVSDDTDG